MNQTFMYCYCCYMLLHFCFTFHHVCFNKKKKKKKKNLIADLEEGNRKCGQLTMKKAHIVSFFSTNSFGCQAIAVFESRRSPTEVMSTTYIFTDDYFENDTSHNNLTNYIPDQDILSCETKPLEPAAALILCLINAAIFLLAIPGNLLVGCVISSSINALTPSDMYLFHLTIADGLMALTIPFSATAMIQGWIFEDFMCKLISFVFDVNFYTSIIFLVCISVDRYLVIVHARETYKHRKRMCSWILCAAVWGLGLALAAPSFFHQVSKISNDSEILICSETYDKDNAALWRLAIRGVHHIFGFLLPLGVMITCYSITIARLLHTRGFHKHRAMKVIIVLVVAFLLCWTPYHLTTIVDTLLRGRVIPYDCAVRSSVSTALTVTNTLALLHSCINPFLYAFVGQRFRKKIMHLSQRKLRKERMSLSKFSRSTSQTSEGSGAVF
ncbi:C-X-C chemokine receptor type 1-like [Anabas testudineus]|uniref:C-X-C chemokine receptor type 1-like n=1 Tax=Anabas testudineus TaxID=64144 RepID=UPI000E45CA71|nr:C-X-C chemokine receptor type 1-like [Anabas testudineus]